MGYLATPFTFSAVLYAPSPSIPNSSGIIVPRSICGNLTG